MSLFLEISEVHTALAIGSKIIPRMFLKCKVRCYLMNELLIVSLLLDTGMIILAVKFIGKVQRKAVL